jgi:hypothetical protein
MRSGGERNECRLGHSKRDAAWNRDQPVDRLVNKASAGALISKRYNPREGIRNVIFFQTGLPLSRAEKNPCVFLAS